MPVEIVTADIFALDVDARVCPTNCLGVMGKGLANQFDIYYPGLEDAYKFYTRHAQRGMYEGDLWAWQSPEGLYGIPDIVLCVATKAHWRQKSTIGGVRRGLFSLRDWCDANPGKSIAVPALGCGLGGLKWEAVKPLALSILGSVENAVYLIEPTD